MTTGFVSQNEKARGRATIGLVDELGVLKSELDESLNLFACLLNDGPFSSRKLVDVGEAGALVESARLVGIVVPDGFVFESGQVFFEGSEGLSVAEVRLSGFVVSESHHEPWATPVRPKLIASGSGHIQLADEDKGRRHLSAKVLSTPNDGLLLSLCEQARQPAPAPAPAPTVVWKDMPTIIDQTSLHLVWLMAEMPWPNQAHHVKDWSHVKAEELAHLVGERRHRSVDERLIVELPGGAYGLTEKGEKRLKDRWRNAYWFTEEVTDNDGVTRQYLLSFVRKNDIELDVRFSVYNESRWLIQNSRDALKARLSSARKALDDAPLGLPFLEQEKTASRQILDNRLQHIRAIEDGLKLMKFLLDAFGATLRNPIHVSMIQLRHVLGCDHLTSENGPLRVRGALEALRRLDFDVALGRIRRRSAFVTAYTERRAGPGASSDGDFSITIGDIAIGGLNVFGTFAQDGKSEFNFKKRLDEDEKARLKTEPFLKIPSSMGAIYETAFTLSPEQSRLWNWIEKNVTLNKDGTAPGRAHLKTANDENPRHYTRDFCELLPSTESFVGALGHYRENAHGGAERGRRLSQSRTTPSATGTSGGREGGLLHVMGMPSSKKSLESAIWNIRVLVEELYGGIVGVRHRGVWMRLTEAVGKLSEVELLEEATLFFFLPKNRNALWRAKYNEHQKRRHERGETRYLFKAVSATEALQPENLPLVERINRALRMTRMSASALAKELGVTRMTVGNWRAGKKPNAEHEPALEAWLRKTLTQPNPSAPKGDPKNDGSGGQM